MIPYIINVGLILAGCIIFYKIFLQRETFHRINRYVLVGCLLVAFALPLLPIPQQWSLRKQSSIENVQGTATNRVPTSTETDPVQNGQTTGAAAEDATPISTTSFFERGLNWLIYLYWFGVLAFGLNFLVQVIVLLYRSKKNPVIIDGQFRIVEVSGDKAPCSFGNNIFINPEKYEWETYNQILQHEKIHIRQKHTLDILLAELVLVFQWFNPFAWLYRREMEKNLEYLTDDQLVNREKVERQSYQLSLLRVSTPHFPLSVTTNYNQSLLKKRIAMMNARRSNVHTAWKYFFLLPLLVLFACLFNEPVVHSQASPNVSVQPNINVQPDINISGDRDGLATEGSWFATLKGEKVSIQFKGDDDDHSFNSTTFARTELKSLPAQPQGQVTFTITRDAGTLELTGRFDGDQGMGRYKFVGDKSYAAQMKADIKDELSEEDQFVFFFVDVKKDYVKMLKNEGFAEIDKDDLIPLAALKVDQAFIAGIRNAGYKDVSLEELIPLKSLGVDGAYIKEMKSVYPKIEHDQLISLKSQGIDKEYVEKVRSGNIKGMSKDADPEEIVSFKAMGIDEKFIASMQNAGFKDLSNQELVSLKAMGITEEYVKGFQSVGFTNLDAEDVVAMKSQGVTPEYVKTFQGMGYKNIKPEMYIGLRSQNITPEYIKSIEALGFKDVDIEEYVGLKSMGITADYIKDMRAKGFNYSRVEKYITLKSLVDEKDKMQ